MTLRGVAAGRTLEPGTLIADIGGGSTELILDGRPTSLDLGCVRHNRDKGVRHALLVASDAAHPDVITLGCADDLKLWHGCTLSMMLNIETTREELQNDKGELFFRAITPRHPDHR